MDFNRMNINHEGSHQPNFIQGQLSGGFRLLHLPHSDYINFYSTDHENIERDARCVCVSGDQLVKLRDYINGVIENATLWKGVPLDSSEAIIAALDDVTADELPEFQYRVRTAKNLASQTA